MSNISQQDLLIEIGTEELPPTSLIKLSTSLKDNFSQQLENLSLSFGNIEVFATPRRLALLIESLDTQQQDKTIQRKGPAVAASYDKEGNPTQAALGFARSCGVELAELATQETDKGAWLSFEEHQVGKKTDSLIQELLQKALSRLPIPKRMRWGDYSFEFIRPIHWLTIIFGDETIPVELYGIKASNITYGHRFLSTEAITIEQANHYEAALEQSGYVIASLNKRKRVIVEQIKQLENSLNAKAIIDDALLDEVTGLVEWPQALACTFSKDFLEVPAEALTSAMKKHQKCFHLVDENSQLLPHFITISNIASSAPELIVAGNERVMRARLADAQFFYQTDQQHALESHLESLKTVVYQQKLGTVYQKAERIATLSEKIATQLNVPIETSKRAGLLAKCDLCTDMVGEFPDLQGTMGYYYAKASNESAEVAQAIREHYQPRFASDKLPESHHGAIVSLADRIDTLIGIFGTGQQPTGEKDPFGLRRHAIAILRIILDKSWALDLPELFQWAYDAYEPNSLESNTVSEAFDYVLERFRHWYQEQGIKATLINAVLAVKPTQPIDFEKRIVAVETFLKQPEADALIAAHKRIGNILQKQAKELSHTIEVNTALLQEDAEINLHKKLHQILAVTEQDVDNQDYEHALTSLSQLKEPVDDFFDNVMVMVDQTDIRANRIALLQLLHNQFQNIAKISMLTN